MNINVSTRPLCMTITKPIFCTLFLGILWGNIAHAATISTYITAGMDYIRYNGGGGYDVVGPDFTLPNSTENNNAGSHESLVAGWGGYFVNTPSGSGYEQTVYAAAQVGHLQAVSSASSATSAAEEYMIDNATASSAMWQDTLVLTSAGASSGYMSFGLDLTGSLDAVGGGGYYEEEPGYWVAWDEGIASWNLDVSLSGGALVNDQYTGYVGSTSGDADSNLPLPIAYNAIPVQFGVPVSVSVSLGTAVFAEAGPGEVTVADARILNSLEWGGITGVVDADGNPLDFSITSESGYDYRLAFADSPEGGAVVPLPPSVVLFAGGLIGFAGLNFRFWTSLFGRYRYHDSA